MSSLCSACQPIYDSWIDYREPYTKWIQYSAPARSVEAYHDKARERRNLIRRQLAGIEETCRNNHPAEREAS